MGRGGGERREGELTSDIKLLYYYIQKCLHLPTSTYICLHTSPYIHPYIHTYPSTKRPRNPEIHIHTYMRLTYLSVYQEIPYLHLHAYP